MPCDTVGHSAPLNYCSDETTIHVGVAADGYDWNGANLSVLFTELATGTVTRFDAEEGQLPNIDIELDGFLPTPGHKYSVRLVGQATYGTSVPLRLRPYTYSTSTEGLTTVANASAVDQVFVEFVKQLDQDGVIVGATEQWIVI